MRLADMRWVKRELVGWNCRTVAGPGLRKQLRSRQINSTKRIVFSLGSTITWNDLQSLRHVHGCLKHSPKDFLLLNVIFSENTSEASKSSSKLTSNVGNPVAFGCTDLKLCCFKQSSLFFALLTAVKPSFRSAFQRVEAGSHR